MIDGNAQLEQALRELDSVRCEVFDRMNDELTARIRLQDARNRHATNPANPLRRLRPSRLPPWQWRRLL